MYKITVSVNVHILPYIEDDEHIRDVKCFETLPEMKAEIIGQLDYIASKVEGLTMKRIREGVTF